jgi:hypothetical protein
LELAEGDAGEFHGEVLLPGLRLAHQEDDDGDDLGALEGTQRVHPEGLDEERIHAACGN